MLSIFFHRIASFICFIKLLLHYNSQVVYQFSYRVSQKELSMTRRCALELKFRYKNVI